jgi:hypothetical protein
MSIGLTDEQLAMIDLPATIRGGLTSDSGQRQLFADGAVAAAIHADSLEVQPSSLAFLAEVVRRGGVAYAVGLPEPLPTAPQSELVRSWLNAAINANAEVFARWLDAVAIVTGSRQFARLNSQ